jgi:hypothetical protein
MDLGLQGKVAIVAGATARIRLQNGQFRTNLFARKLLSLSFCRQMRPIRLF